MTDITSIIELVIAIAIVYFLIRFIIGPVAKAIVGIVIFLILIYLLQRFLGFNIDNALATFGISLNLNRWISSFDWILSPANYYIDQIKNVLQFATQGLPKLPIK